MKVQIGPYINWLGPYQLADKLMWAIGEDRAHKLGEYLASTWVNDFLTWVHSKRNRKISIRIDEYDTWSMDDTLALIILPMLKQLKETKHGSPFTDNEDVPEELWNRNTNEYEDDTVHQRWDYILNKMIFAFEHIVDDSWEDEYYSRSDMAARKKIQDEITIGLALFGKYYQALWD